MRRPHQLSMILSLDSQRLMTACRATRLILESHRILRSTPLEEDLSTTETEAEEGGTEVSTPQKEEAFRSISPPPPLQGPLSPQMVTPDQCVRYAASLVT